MAFSPVVKLCHNGSSELNDPIYRWQTFLLQWIKTSYLQTINLPLPLLMHDTQILNSHLLLPYSQFVNCPGWMSCTVTYQHTLQHTWHFQRPFGYLFLACWPAHCCHAVLRCSDHQTSVSEQGMQWENGKILCCGEGTLHILPGVVCSEEKLIFFHRLHIG